METLKNTQIVTFTKVNTLAGKEFTTEITIEFGTNAKGNDLRNFNQINTANEVIDEAGKDFEDGIVSLESFKEVIKGQGYSETK